MCLLALGVKRLRRRFLLLPVPARLRLPALGRTDQFLHLRIACCAAPGSAPAHSPAAAAGCRVRCSCRCRRAARRACRAMRPIRLPGARHRCRPHPPPCAPARPRSPCRHSPGARCRLRGRSPGPGRHAPGPAHRSARRVMSSAARKGSPRSSACSAMVTKLCLSQGPKKALVRTTSAPGCGFQHAPFRLGLAAAVHVQRRHGVALDIRAVLAAVEHQVAGEGGQVDAVARAGGGQDRRAVGVLAHAALDVVLGLVHAHVAGWC
jgi:hypothetical protein